MLFDELNFCGWLMVDNQLIDYWLIDQQLIIDRIKVDHHYLKKRHEFNSKVQSLLHLAPYPLQVQMLQSSSHKTVMSHLRNFHEISQKKWNKKNSMKIHNDTFMTC